MTGLGAAVGDGSLYTSPPFWSPNHAFRLRLQPGQGVGVGAGQTGDRLPLPGGHVLEHQDSQRRWITATALRAFGASGRHGGCCELGLDHLFVLALHLDDFVDRVLLRDIVDHRRMDTAHED
jgi:hypothetical protein